MNEAIDTGSTPNLFHPSKLAKYATKKDVETLFPDLGPEAQRYVEIITGDSYKKTVERLEYYTGKTAQAFNLPTLLSTIMSAMQQVVQIQQGNEKQLEQLALDVVLQLPEFKMFKQLYQDGLIKFDVQLLDANLDNAITEQEKQEQTEQPANENDLTEGEEANLEFAEEFADIDDGALKRQFANMVTQGNAVNKLYLFQLANDALNKIDPKLVGLYGILSVVVQLSYYATPDIPLTAAAKDMAVGSEEIEPNEDGTYTIVARSPFFPYLIHEIVKGLYDYLSIDITTQANLSGETLDQELIDIMSGPQLYTNLAKLLPAKDVEFLPLVFKLLLQKDMNIIKTVLTGGGRAQNIINNILQQAKELQDNYDKGSYGTEDL